MEISSESQGPVLVVKLVGNLDTNSSPEVQEYLARSIDEGAEKVLVSFSTVDFVSSAGLRILLATAKKLGGGGQRFRICGLNESVAEVFEISGFSTILDVHPTEAEALAGF